MHRRKCQFLICALHVALQAALQWCVGWSGTKRQGGTTQRQPTPHLPALGWVIMQCGRDGGECSRGVEQRRVNQLAPVQGTAHTDVRQQWSQVISTSATLLPFSLCSPPSLHLCPPPSILSFSPLCGLNHFHETI